ncbi:pentatricopeptide repeat-containing protein-like [Dorcoceras hygrometricum]|uniref:Pentatricopeptide repeat-containing protein-like n=1 Tax=Dorcoceras hygrometricum TaxID=472368 RepID=A0A2Z7AF63_9LAMI|nr:pentatricopeptide repeat-containing protein-like [Dorcoceras hygrometricum]
MLRRKPALIRKLDVAHRRDLGDLPLHQPLLPPSVKSTPLPLLADQCKSMDQLKQIQCQMVIKARIQDTYAASRLLNFCALSASGDITYAIKLLEHISEPNLFMWNTIIRSLAGTSCPDKGLLFYKKMLEHGFKPGKYTFPFVLKACSKMSSIKCCEQVHAHLLIFGLDVDLHVVNGLIRAYSVLGGLANARKAFDDIPCRNLSIWTTMICGYAQNSSAEEAIRLFYAMLSDAFEPNEIVFSSVLSACAHSGCLDLGEKIHVYIEEKDIELGVILGTALVNMYAKNGALLKAKQCFDCLKEKNIATWNAIICGLAVHGHAEEAIRMFKMLEQENVRPNDITFVGVLSACCHAGLLSFGREIFNSMKMVYGVEPKIEHYGCMVDLLGRGGQVLEAEELIKGMVWQADVVIWGTLLSACKERGHVEVAERAVKKILELDPQNHGVFVILSNMYAESGRWDDVTKRRRMMKEGYLKKTAGWSLVGGECDS